MTVYSVFKLNNQGAHTHTHIRVICATPINNAKVSSMPHLRLFELVWRMPRCVPFLF